MNIRPPIKISSLTLSESDLELMGTLYDTPVTNGNLQESEEGTPFFPKDAIGGRAEYRQSPDGERQRRIEPIYWAKHPIAIRRCRKCGELFDARVGTMTIVCEKCGGQPLFEQTAPAKKRRRRKRKRTFEIGNDITKK